MKITDNPCWFLWVIFVTDPKHQQSHPHGLPRQPFPTPNLMPARAETRCSCRGWDGSHLWKYQFVLWCLWCSIMQLHVYEHNLLYSSHCSFSNIFRVIIMLNIWHFGGIPLIPHCWTTFFSPKTAILLDSTQAPLDLLRITSQSTSCEAKQSERQKMGLSRKVVYPHLDELQHYTEAMMFGLWEGLHNVSWREKTFSII